MTVNNYNQKAIRPGMWLFGVILLIVAWSLIVFYSKGKLPDYKPTEITVTERYLDRMPVMEYGTAVDFLGKKKYWMFKFELYSDEGNAFNAQEYLKQYPLDAVWKFNSGDGQIGVKIFTNNKGEKVRDGWVKVKNNRYD